MEGMRLEPSYSFDLLPLNTKQCEHPLLALYIDWGSIWLLIFFLASVDNPSECIKLQCAVPDYVTSRLGCLSSTISPPWWIDILRLIVVVVQSRLSLCDPLTAACQASLSFTISQSLLKLMAIESVMPSNHLILCHPLVLLSSIFPSNRAFSSESSLCIRSPKYGTSA